MKSNNITMKNIAFITGLVALVTANTAPAQSTKTIPNFSAANLVLGRADFRGQSAGNGARDFSTIGVGEVAVDATTRKVFVADGFRVLRFSNADALANGATAEAVFGQGNFETNATPDTPNENRFSAVGIHIDTQGRLWIADINNYRVLRFDNANTTGNFPAATRVYGQPNFTSKVQRFNAVGMAGPSDVVVDANDRLWVADANNNRVLRFDNITNKPNGAAADAVLGQTVLDTGGGAGPEGLSQSKMDLPYSLAVSSSGTLFVSERDNNRVLRFDNAATLANGANANVVLGQPNFTTKSLDLVAAKMNQPSGISLSSDDTLWVADKYYARVTRFDNASTKGNGAAADGVLGQPDLFSDKQNNNTQGFFSANSQGLLFPAHVFVDNVKGGVWVSDTQNNRVLRFGGASSVITPPSGDTVKPNLVVAKTLKSTKAKKITIKGTATDNSGSVARVQYRLGTGAFKNATGSAKWQFSTSLKKGKNSITINAIDAAGNVSANQVVKIVRK
jgi:sugar lactone lactonase YvrE